MNLPLTIPDILLFTTFILLLSTIILLVKKINSKNYLLIGTLAIYFCFISTTIGLILFTRYNIKVLNSTNILICMSIVYTLYNVFHYFSLHQLIVKKSYFKLDYLIHLISIITIGILIFYFFEPLHSIKGKGYNFIFETQHLMIAQRKNLTLSLTRIIHPLFYLILGGYLLFSFYTSPRYLSINKQIRYFILFLYLQKIFMFIWVTIGFIGFNIDSNLYSTISITGYSITSLVMSSYILLSPTLIIKITKLHKKSDNTPIDLSKLPDLATQLGQMINESEFYLSANYSLTNLSSDTNIPINTIRKIITTSGFKNYSAYINSFRIAHAEKLIFDGYLNIYSIESLCKDSGFQSEVTFYRVFKKINNCTPKEFSYNLNGSGKKFDL